MRHLIIGTAILGGFYLRTSRTECLYLYRDPAQDIPYFLHACFESWPLQNRLATLSCEGQSRRRYWACIIKLNLN